MEAIVEKDKVRAYVLAGHALFTLLNKATGNRFTFSVRVPKVTRPGVTVHFVRLHHGGADSSTFIGTIFDCNLFRHSQKSPVSANAQSVRVFEWFMAHIDTLPEGIEVWHNGRCGRCGRILTVPESITIGIGPECIKKMGM
jgi:hypothetical protein